MCPSCNQCHKISTEETQRSSSCPIVCIFVGVCKRVSKGEGTNGDMGECGRSDTENLLAGIQSLLKHTLKDECKTKKQTNKNILTYQGICMLLLCFEA